MKTKENWLKLIVSVLMCLIFACLFSVGHNVYAVTINGTVEDETGSPIPNVNVKGNPEYQTSNNGLYEVNISGDKIEYEFQEEYKDAKAFSEVYIPKTTKKYNIVIVKPENDYENEYQEIKNILSNCEKENEKIIIYNADGFSDGITDPYQEYKDICGEKYLDNDYINLFIVIGKDDIPMIKTTSEQGKLADGNIFYNQYANKLPKHMQISPIFEQVRQKIMEYGKIEEKSEELDIDLNSNNATAWLKENKNQRVRLVLTRKEEINIGDFITGTIYLEDGSRDKITKEEYGNDLNNITVELINLDTGNVKITQVQDGSYGFDREQEAGRYKLRFKYNGQEFKTIENESNNVIEENSNRNHIQEELDREGFNDRNNGINNEKAKKILNWDEDLINIYAYTVEFEVKDNIPPSLEEPDGYTDPNKYINLVLEKRPEFEIEFKKEINVVKVTLSDGQIYQENRMDEISSQVQMRQIIMDEELMHGATIEIEYLITVTIPETAEGEIKIEEIKVIDYLDYERNDLEYNPNKELLTINSKNSDYSWELKNKTELNNIEQSLLDTNEENGELKEIDYLIGTLQRVDDKTYQTRLVVSKMVGANLDEEDLLYSNSIEIIEYSNSEGRRMVWADNANLTDKDENIPGNFNPNVLNDDVDYINTVQDTAVAEDVFIIPPFGGKNNVFINLNKYIEQKKIF